MQISNKIQMYELYRKGLFGNKFNSWQSLEEFEQADQKLEYVGIRCCGGIGLPCYTQVPRKDVRAVYLRLRTMYKCSVIIYEPVPDHMITLQGEYSNSLHGISLEATQIKMPMRYALAEERLIFYGPRGRIILKSFCDDASYEDILFLDSEYSNCVIEFTCFSCSVGCAKGRNTVIWEVRNY